MENDQQQRIITSDHDFEKQKTEEVRCNQTECTPKEVKKPKTKAYDQSIPTNKSFSLKRNENEWNNL